MRLAESLESTAIDVLTRLSERELQNKVVEPLLRKMGFSSVRDNSGPGEKGKDLVAVKDDLGRPLLYAFQLKKFRPSADVSSTSFSRLCLQLRQAAMEPVLDPVSQVFRRADRVVFITPFAVPRTGFESALAESDELRTRGITVIDGPLLVDLIAAYIPSVLDNVNVELKYRLAIARKAGAIPEAAIFGLPDALRLDTLFVETSVCCGGAVLHVIAESAAKADHRPAVSSVRELKEIVRISRTYLGVTPKVFVQKTNKQVSVDALIGKSDGFAKRKTVEAGYCLDASALLSPIQRKAAQHLRALSGIASSTRTKNTDRKTIRELLRFSRDVGRLINTTSFREAFPNLLQYSEDVSSIAGEAIPSTSLLKLPVSQYVYGGAGYGKTTLLRRLAQTMASQNAQLPVFVPLVRVAAVTRERAPELRTVDDQFLFNAIQTALIDQGYTLNAPSLKNRLKEGSLWVFLDGLDEAGSRAKSLGEVIRYFSKKYDKVGLTVSCRDTYPRDEWDDFLQIRIGEFSDLQQERFVDNWFEAAPSRSQGLKEWLRNHAAMRSVARTPLIAALLCSLYNVDAELPATETELYAERFEFMLGKWEQAKGIRSMPVQIRRRYLAFLSKLALRAHIFEVRNFPEEIALGFAERYYSKTYHVTAKSMLDDCVHRGLLHREPSGELSFGHLTYQEFLVGRQLSIDNPVLFVWSVSTTPWWQKSVEFYASLQGDIGPLLKESLHWCSTAERFERLNWLVRLAPFTAPQLVEKMRCQTRSPNLKPVYKRVSPRVSSYAKDL